MELWQPQRRALACVESAIEQGIRRILLEMPTGMGKTRVASVLVKDFLEEAKKVVFYSNRKLLVEQTAGVMGKSGIDHGIRMSGAKEELDQRFQVSSIQTEGSRTLRKQSWTLHDADLVVVDEAHLNGGPTAQKLVTQHLEKPGCVVLGLTATPIDLAHFYDHLICGATVSEGRACGALVPAYHYGPDEPDLKHIGRVELGEDLTESQNRTAMGKVVAGKADRKLTKLFGRVIESYLRLNRERKPTLLFAPGVAESIWFAEEFTKLGIRAASIDGTNIWLDGEFYETSQHMRDEVITLLRRGEVQVLCNRFVCREGIDVPEIEHIILATVIGSLQSYLQIGGRGLRACPSTGKTQCVVQDHSGSWHKFGSLNADREWDLGCTAQTVVGVRQERLRNKTELEPVRCPICAAIIRAGMSCPCGFIIGINNKSRPVIQHDGSLKEYHGDIYKPRATKTEPDTEAKWKRMYYRAKNSGTMTFNQARGLFFHEERYYPPDNLKLMPKTEIGWFRKVSEVEWEDLN